MINLYCLVDPRTSKPFYVGITVCRLNSRLSGHIAEIKAYQGRHRSEKQEFLREMVESGVRPTIQLLRQVSLNETDFYEFFFYEMFIKQGYKMYQWPPSQDYKRKNTAYKNNERQVVVRNMQHLFKDLFGNK